MFDNPNEELKKLEAKLLAAEEKEPDFETFYQDILREFGPDSKTPQPRRSPVPKHPVYADLPEKKPAKKKKERAAGLVVLLCLECAGIVGIVLWWVLRIFG